VATSFEAVYDILVTKGRSFAGRSKSFRRKLLSHGGKDIILGSPTEPHWTHLRKAALKTVRQQQHGDSGDKTEDLVAMVTDEFVTKVLSYAGQPVDIRDDIYNFAIKDSFILAVGRKPDDDEPVFRLTKHFLTERAAVTSIGATVDLELDCFPWLRHLGHPVYRRLLMANRQRDHLWSQLWTETRARYNCSDSTSDEEEREAEYSDLLYVSAQMLDDQSPHYKESLDSEHAKGMFTNMLAGSVATTSSSAYVLLNILLHHPHVLHRLQQEVDRVLADTPDDTSSTSGRLVSHRQRMPYTNSVLLELLRYTSVVPTFGHAAIEDTSILDTPIPAGTGVLPILAAVHHDEQFWGDPWVFRPERFLDDDGSLLPAHHACRKHVIAFGAGPRMCVGESFAMKRLFVFLTTVIQTFELQAGDVTASCDPRNYITGNVLYQPNYTIKMMPRNHQKIGS
jgi:cytochrome P450